MKRRDFLKSTAQLAALSGLSSLAPLFARASTEEEQYLIAFEMGGGWDISLSLDAWTAAQRPDVKDYFIEYTPNDLFNVGNVVYGPALANIKNTLADFSVIRGVFLAASDSGHTAAMSMMRSGDASKNPDLLMQFASEHEEHNLGVLSSMPLNAGPLKATTYSINDLIVSAMSMPEKSNGEARGALAKAKNSNLVFAPLFKEFNSTRAQLMTQPGSQDSEMQQILSIAAAFKSGLSRSALINTIVNLDTHSNHEKTHMAEQIKGWESLNKLVTVLKQTPAKTEGQSLFDRTTIMVYSEFARTPALNPAGGKDHNPLVNSVLVSGPGFRKGVAVGGSRIVGQAQSKTGAAYHVAVPTNMTTGAPILERADYNQGVLVTPQHVMATIADSMKLNRDTFRCASPETPSIRLLLQS